MLFLLMDFVLFEKIQGELVIFVFPYNFYFLISFYHIFVFFFKYRLRILPMKTINVIELFYDDLCIIIIRKNEIS
jgi:hypothetical protein